MHATICPPKETIQDYLSGRLGPQDSDVIEEHVDTCAECEHVVQALDAEPDSLVDLLTSEPFAASEAAHVGSANEQADVGLDIATVFSTESLLRQLPSQIGAYDILQVLGRGGMGAVFLARHRELGKQVALKVLPLHAKNEEWVARFRREIKTAGLLEHSAIVRSTDAGEDKGLHYLAMDAIDGLDLSRLCRSRQIPIADACELIRQAAVGLAYAHEQGVVHRDIKPSNLMLDSQGHVRILDFGLAQLGLWNTPGAEITTVGQLMGTLDYMAPEQAERGGAVDYRADIYSLGATLYRLLSGRAPLAAAPDLTPLAKLRLLATHSPPRLETLRADVPSELSEILEQLLAKDPADRPPSAAHVVEMLEPFCEGAQPTHLLKAAHQAPADGFPIDSSSGAGFWLPRNSQANPAEKLSTREQRSGISGLGIGNSLLWVAGLLFAAGIFFIVETSKGQLVIQSDVADVHVRLRKDGKITQDLRIEPGAKATRLWSGKYEIEIDAASDAFTLSNQEFTIRSGDTVVARISAEQPRPREQKTAIAEDNRLNEVVYQGETLDVWLRRLQFERSNDEVTRSLQALQALASPDLAEILRPAVKMHLIDNWIGKTQTQLALEILVACSPETYFTDLCELLESSRSDRKRLALAEQYSVHLAALKAGVDAEPLIQWMEDTLASRADEPFALSLANTLVSRPLYDLPDRWENAQRERLVAALENCEALDDAFWFGTPELKRVYWSENWRSGVRRRAMRILVDKHADVRRRVVAATAMANTAHYGGSLDAQQAQQLKQVLRSEFEQVLRDPEPYLHLGTFEYKLDSVPATDNGRWYDAGDKANLLVSLLNLVVRFELQDEFKTELTRLEDQFRAMPLYGTQRRPGLADNLPTYWKYGLQSNASMLGAGQFNERDKKKYLCQLIFLQLGLIRGAGMEELESRFAQRLDADHLAAGEEIISSLVTGTKKQRIDALGNAYDRLSPLCKDKALPAIQQLLSELAKQETRYAIYCFGMLCRMDSTTHFSRLKQCLQESPNPKMLLAQLAFHDLPEFECHDVEDLEVFLNWCDEVMQPVGEPDSGLQEVVWRALESLCKDRSALIAEYEPRNDVSMPPGEVSDECFQRIVQHLMQYKQLTPEAFWLHHPRDRVCDIFQKEVANQAVTVLIDNTASKQLKSQAIACLINVTDEQVELDALRTRQLTEWVSEQLSAWGTDPEAVKELVELSGSEYSSAVSTSYWDRDFRRNAEETIKADYVCLTLSLVSRLSIQDRLQEALATFADSRREQMEMSSRKAFQGFGPRSIREAMARNMVSDLLVQAQYHWARSLSGVAQGQITEEIQAAFRKAEDRRNRFVAPRDTLAVYIPGVFPTGAKDPPVMQAGNKPPVVGYPVPVDTEGKILIPGIGALHAAGLDLPQLKQELADRLEKVYANASDASDSISVEFLMRQGETYELRNLGSERSVKTP